MNLQVRMALEGNLASFAAQVHKQMARGARAAAERMAQRALLLLREDTRQGGLGNRVANAWQPKTYPKSASVETLHPAAMVYSKAPVIIAAFSAETVIYPKNTVSLAIPTDNVPRRGNKRMTPVEVEARFDQDLILKPSRRPGITYGFVNAVRSKNGRTFRRPTKGRIRQSRKVELVLMFVFVKQVRLRKRLDTKEIMASLEAEWLDILGTEVNRALN